MTDLKELLLTRLSLYDTTLDLSENSPIVAQVVNPVVSLFEKDPLGVDIQSFLVAKVEEAFPDIKLTAGDALFDILITSISLFFEVYRREVSRIANSQSIANIDTLSDEDADALAANWLVDREMGRPSTCVVRVIFSKPVNIRIDSETVFSTPDGDLFIPNGAHEMSATAMLDYQLASREYYFDIDVISIFVGSDQNVDAGRISNVTGLSNVVSVTNITAATGGKNKEENRELLLTKIPKSISERSLVTVRGIVAKILNTFSSIKDIQVIGFGDLEMERDAVEIDGLGAVKSMGFSFVHRTLTKAIVCPISLSDAKLIEGDTLLLALLPRNLGSDVAQSKHAFKITKVESYTSDSILPRTGTYICNIEPIIEDDLTQVVVQNEEWLAGYSTIHEIETVYLGGESFKEDVHIGGKADIYVYPKEDVDGTTQLDIKSNKRVSTGLGITSSVGSNRVQLSLSPTDDGRMFEPGKYLSIGSASTNEFFKLRHVDVGLEEVVCYLDRPLYSAYTEDLPIRWSLFDSFEINASSDREVYLPTVETQRFFVTSIIGSNILRTSAPLNLATYGISFQPDSPVFYIDINVESGTFVSQIVGFSQDEIEISTNMPLTGANLEIEIYTLVESIPLPLTHVNSVHYGNQLDIPLPYGRSLGGKILYVGGARENQRGLLGFVAPKYYEMFGKTSNALLPSMDMDFDSYQVLVGDSYSTLGAANTPRNNLPYSFGMGDPLENSVVLRYEYSSQGSKYYSEFLLPSELFLPGDYNIFVGIGNHSFEDIKGHISSGGDFPFELNMNYPIQGSRGDILTINSGPNSGSYIIDRVYQVPVYLGDLYTDGDISTYAIEEINPQVIDLDVRNVHKSEIFKLSVVRIFGSFKSSPLAMFESSFELDAQFPAPIGLSELDGSISLEAALAMLMNPSKLIRKTNSQLSDSLEEAVRLRLGDIPVDGTAALAINLAENLMPSCFESYSTGNASSGKARIYLESPSTIRLPSPKNQFISHAQVNTTLNEASSGDAISSLVSAKEFFYMEYNGLRYTLQSDQDALELIYSPEDIDLEDPLSWGRNLDISNVGANLPEGLHIPSNINLDGRNAIEISSDEDTFGVDIVRLPENYESSINRITLDQSESLIIHHEASKPYSNFYEAEKLEIFFVVFSGDAQLSFNVNQNVHSYLYVRAGIPAIEPEVWVDSFIRPILLTSGQRVELGAEQGWYDSREAGIQITSDDFSINTELVKSLRDVNDVSGYVRVNGEIIEDSSINLYINSYGQTVYEVFSEVLRLDPDAKIILFPPDLVLPEAPGLNTDINNHLIHTSLYRFQRAVEIESGVPNCGLLSGVTSRGSNIIHFPSKFSSLQEDFPLNSSDIGSLLFIEQGPDKGGYKILDVNSNSRAVYLDSALIMSTAEIDARGVATIDLDAPDNNKVYVSGSDKIEVYEEDGIVKRRVVSPENDFSLPFNGVTSRIPTSLDIGKYLTLYSFTRRPDQLKYPVEETPFTPVREHLGSFKITGVDVVRVIEAGTGNSEVLSATLIVETPINTSFTSPIDERFLETYFVISPDTIPPEEGEIKGFVPVHVYEAEPTEYELVGQYLDVSLGSLDLAISTRGYDTPSAVSSVGPFIRYNGSVDGVNFVNVGMDRNNPFLLVRSGSKKLEPSGTEGNFSYVDLDIQSIGFEEEYNLQTGEMFTTYGERIDGYVVNPLKLDNAFSEDETVMITIPGALDVSSTGVGDPPENPMIYPSLSINHRYSPDTQAVQHFSNRTSERVVCSHIRSKRMLPAYFGINMSFFGGVSARDVASTIKSIIDNAVITRTPFSSSDLIHAAHLRGASRVSTPLSMYYLVVDKGRRRHLRFVDTEFSPFTLANYQGSIRTTSLHVTELNKSTLGVQLSISPAANTTIGGV